MIDLRYENVEAMFHGIKKNNGYEVPIVCSVFVSDLNISNLKSQKKWLRLKKLQKSVLLLLSL